MGQTPLTAAQKMIAERRQAVLAKVAEQKRKVAAAKAKQPFFRCDQHSKSTHDGVVRYHITWDISTIKSPTAPCSPVGDVWIRFSRLRPLMLTCKQQLPPDAGRMMVRLPDGGLFEIFKTD